MDCQFLQISYHWQNSTIFLHFLGVVIFHSFPELGGNSENSFLLNGILILSKPLPKNLWRTPIGKGRVKARFLPPANEVWGKVLFLHLCVILFWGGGFASSGGLHLGVDLPPQGGACIWRGLGSPPIVYYSRWAMRILLEWILVHNKMMDQIASPRGLGGW